MMRKSTSYRYFWIILIALIAATMFSSCSGREASPMISPTDVMGTSLAMAKTEIIETLTAAPASTTTFSLSTVPISTLIPITVTPSPLPTRPPVPIITPNSIQLERWIEYEDALKQSILPTWSFKSLHCEWDILARVGQEVYVWALCGSSKGTDMRPAVIYLRSNGSVRSVEILRRGHPTDIDRLFPKEAQAKFSFYEGMSAFDGRLKEMLDHLYYRETHPEEPPLVILSAIPIVTLTP